MAVLSSRVLRQFSMGGQGLKGLEARRPPPRPQQCVSSYTINGVSTSPQNRSAYLLGRKAYRVGVMSHRKE